MSSLDSVSGLQGLGTSSNKEAKDYFSKLENHQIDFLYESELDSEVLMLTLRFVCVCTPSMIGNWNPDLYPPGNIWISFFLCLFLCLSLSLSLSLV